MIQWIALAVAVNANSKAGDALENSEKQKRNNGDPFIVVKPFGFSFIRDEMQKGFFSSIFPSGRSVLDKEPFGSFSIRRSDIINLSEHKDDDNKTYVAIQLYEEADIVINDQLEELIYIPGTLEEVTAVLNS